MKQQFLFNAKFFSSSDEIVTLIEKDSDFARPNKMGNGEIFPPRMIHDASGLNYKNMLLKVLDVGILNTIILFKLVYLKKVIICG